VHQRDGGSAGSGAAGSTIGEGSSGTGSEIGSGSEAGSTSITRFGGPMFIRSSWNVGKTPLSVPLSVNAVEPRSEARLS
jgi:hypothetical protein